MALVHHWPLNEENATDVAVDLVGGLTLTPAAGNEPAVASGFWGNARAWTTGNRYLQGDPVATGNVQGNRSLAWWMAGTGNIAVTSGGIFFVGCSNTADVTARNFARMFCVDVAATSDTVRGGYCNSTGNQNSWTSNLGNLEASLWMHHAIVFAGRFWQYYRNGVGQESGTLAADPYTPDSGDNNPPLPDVTWIGRSADGTTVAKELTNSMLKDVRLFNHSLTSAEVQALFLGGVTAVDNPADTTAPVISSVTPAPGSISRNGTWAFRLTEGVAFRRSGVNVTLKDAQGNERAGEWVWNGTRFGPAYLGSTRTEVTPGLAYDFVIRRTGGWPFSPSFDPFAIDTSGNEGT